MIDVLLTHSYFLHFDSKQLKAGMPYAPLATLFAASMLLKNGYATALHDNMFEKNIDAFKAQLDKAKPKLLVIYDDGFNYLTKMCLTNMREAAFDMIAYAKSKGCRVAISSSDATDHTEAYLQKGADFIIAGEGEFTLLGLCDIVFKNQGNKSNIDGLIYVENNLLVKNNPRNNLKNLDELPIPAWHLINLKPYQKMWQQHKGCFSINLVTTRGCPYKCNWCAKPIYGNRYNSHSPQYVVNQIIQLQQTHAITHIWFADDIFGLKPGWVKAFAKLISENNISIKYKIQSRVDLLLEPDYVSYLAQSGCDEVWVGAESGSQKILDAMDKGTRVEQIEQATTLLKKHHIKPCFFLQFGYPSENKTDIESTISMVKKLMPHDIGISVSYPLPGTKFYQNVKEQLTSKQNWTDSDELLVMFKGAYPPSFYKTLQRLVHYKFRTWQAIDAWQSKRNVTKALSLVIRLPQVFVAQQRLKKYGAIA